jgi:hypothetical protein
MELLASYLPQQNLPPPFQLHSQLWLLTTYPRHFTSKITTLNAILRMCSKHDGKSLCYNCNKQFHDSYRCNHLVHVLIVESKSLHIFEDAQPNRPTNPYTTHDYWRPKPISNKHSCLDSWYYSPQHLWVLGQMHKNSIVILNFFNRKNIFRWKHT